jgi:biotin carboxylase
LKPLALSGSRGVIRANNLQEAEAAFGRIAAMLRSPEIRVLREETSDFIQVEEYVDGIEVAVEAVVEHGRLKLLAIFDKPDPLTGPYFEETIYVTPSRLSATAEQLIAHELESAVVALGLQHGPVHAELRLESAPQAQQNGHEAYRVWIMEVAARCIGGLCARALRFTAPDEDRQFGLEELIIRLGLSENISALQREQRASGVLMIPIAAEGIYESTDGLDEARETQFIEEIFITAKEGQRLVPLPEGSSYLGFIFAHAETPEQVEHALRAAHSRLSVVLAPALPVL